MLRRNFLLGILAGRCKRLEDAQEQLKDTAECPRLAPPLDISSCFLIRTSGLLLLRLLALTAGLEEVLFIIKEDANEARGSITSAGKNKVVAGNVAHNLEVLRKMRARSFDRKSERDINGPRIICS